MNRKEKYKDFREQCSETKLIDILDMQDKKINLLMNRVEHLVEMVEKQSSSLYELSKQPTEIFKNDVDDLNKTLTLNVYSDISKEAFDEKFKDSIEELEKIIFFGERKNESKKSI